MKNKAFTLIELLAVIVILAIIALIAVPIILNIIEDTKVSSDKRSIESYGKAVENAIANYQVKNTNDNEITLEKIKTYIEYKGNEVKCVVYIYDDGSVYLEGCSVNGKKVEYTYGVDTLIIKKAQEENKTIAGKIPQGNFELGDEYIINVDGTNKYHFYVLNIEGDKVSLIMSNNICSDGTLATASNTCLIPWVSKEDYKDDTNYGDYGNNDKGPITVMNYLYETTKNWSNIENIQMNYIDEGNTGEYGYGEIKTSGNITTITKKDGTVTATYENLKARMPKILEIEGTGCSGSKGSCPAWMANGLASVLEYPVGTKEDIENIKSYVSLSSDSSRSYNTRLVRFDGYVNKGGASSPYGIRPVIELSKTDLK